MNVHRVTLQKTQSVDVLVIADNSTEACNMAEDYNNNNDLFDYIDEDIYSNAITFSDKLINKLIKSDELKKEIKDYGILLNENNRINITYNTNIIQEIKEQQEKIQKEKYLKKYHMEFQF